MGTLRGLSLEDDSAKGPILLSSSSGPCIKLQFNVNISINILEDKLL